MSRGYCVILGQQMRKKALSFLNRQQIALQSPFNLSLCLKLLELGFLKQSVFLNQLPVNNILLICIQFPKMKKEHLSPVQQMGGRQQGHVHFQLIQKPKSICCSQRKRQQSMRKLIFCTSFTTLSKIWQPFVSVLISVRFLWC